MTVALTDKEMQTKEGSTGRVVNVAKQSAVKAVNVKEVLYSVRI